MKTAISLPDAVFREAEKFARLHRKSRSKLYADAILEYLERHAPETITEAMNRVLERVGPEDIAFAKAASRLILGRERW